MKKRNVGVIGNGKWAKIILPKIWPLRLIPSESTQESTVTKSDTKLGTEHLKIASLPTMTLSRKMSTSKC